MMIDLVETVQNRRLAAGRQMGAELAITGAVTRKTSRDDSRRLLELLVAEIPGSVGYLKAFKPGVYAEAFDWLLVLNTTASAATIAGALWKVYQRFARSSGETENRQTLVIQLKDASGQSSQITVDSRCDQTVLVREVSKSIETIVSEGANTELRQRVEESERWIRLDRTP